jgi:hypothetical protein
LTSATGDQPFDGANRGSLDHGDTFELCKECIQEGMPTAAGRRLKRFCVSFSATRAVLERELPGFGEAMRMQSLRK